MKIYITITIYNVDDSLHYIYISHFEDLKELRIQVTSFR